MSETRERSALEVLRRLNALVEERHIVVMGPQDLTDPLWDDIEALLATPASDGGEVRGDAPAGATLYRRRCGWCGAYEGTVDPKEPCAKDEIGYIGPHQFEVLEAVVSGSGAPPGEGKVRVAAAAYLDALDEYRQECRTRDIPLAEYDYHEWRRLAEPVTVAERRLHEALRSAPSGAEEGESEWEPMSMSMAGVAHSRLVPFRHRPSDVVAWVDQRAAARLRGEGGGE